MSRRVVVLGLVWIAIAFFLLLKPHSGGDATITHWLLYTIWTIPFSMVWQFYIYSPLQEIFANIKNSFLIGNVIVIFLSFIFWFVLIPKLHKFLTDKFGGKKEREQ